MLCRASTYLVTIQLSRSCGVNRTLIKYVSTGTQLCVHINLLNNLESDLYFLQLLQLVCHRATPAGLVSNKRTNHLCFWPNQRINNNFTPVPPNCTVLLFSISLREVIVTFVTKKAATKTTTILLTTFHPTLVVLFYFVYIFYHY